MQWPSLLVLVRHPESEGNLLSVDDISTLDVPNHAFDLTDRGEKQAMITGEYLKKKYGQFDAYFISTFKRTRRGMEIMFPGVSYIQDSRLDEWWRGIWHAMSKAEVTLHYPDEARVAQLEGLYHHRAPQGESCPDVEARIYSFNQDLRQWFSDKKICICGHGNWFILFQRIIHALSIEAVYQKRKEKYFPNASVAVYRPDQTSPWGLGMAEGVIVPWQDKI